jgi:hypothetical protein
MPRGVRFVPPRTSPLESIDASNESPRRGTLRTRDRARPGVLACMVRTGRRLFGEPDQRGRTAARCMAEGSGCRCTCGRQRS